VTIAGGLNSSSSLATDANISGSHLSVRYGWFADCLFFKNWYEHDACIQVVQKPARNIYFRNITFDGDNTAQMAFFIRAMRDVVFDDVTFKNFHDPRNYHAGPVNSNATVSNIWCRRCHFVGSQSYGWVMDGMHGGGVIESRFERNFHSGGILFLTNDDYTNDYDNDGIIGLHEQRVTQYGVVSGNTFTFSHHIVDATSANTLVENNTVTEGTSVFVNFDIRHANRSTRYYYYGNTVVNNIVNKASVLVDIGNRGICHDIPSGTGPPPRNCSFHGNYTIRDNVVMTSIGSIVAASTDRLQAPITVMNNCVGGVLWGTTTLCTPPPFPTPIPPDNRAPITTPDPSPGSPIRPDLR